MATSPWGGNEAHEPVVERQATLAVARPELGGAGLAGHHERQLDEVVGVPAGHDLAGREAHDLEVSPRRLDLVEDDRLERADDLAVGAVDLADDLGLVDRAPVRERRVGVDELERRRRVEALADARLEDLALLDRLPEVSIFHWLVGTLPDASPGRSMPVGAPNPN